MSIIQHSTARRVRAALVTTAIVGASMAGLLGTGAAQASGQGSSDGVTGAFGPSGGSGGSLPRASTASHRVAGFVTVDSCTGVSGTITYSPGLRSTKIKAEQAILSGTTSGCSDLFNGPMSGTGTFTAVLSGNASVAAENFTGTFTINWPAASGLNPSTGTLSVTEASRTENVSGTVTGGADTGTVLAMQYVTTGSTGNGTKKHPVTAQTFTNSQALTLSRNEG